jgi:hypothetical protein
MRLDGPGRIFCQDYSIEPPLPNTALELQQH